MMPWFRLYPEILKDPKIRRFTTVQKWLWITAMCEASQSSERGKLFIADGIEYTDEDLAQAAGLPSGEWEQAKGFIDMCVTLKMMERHADGGVTLLNWIERQRSHPEYRLPLSEWRAIREQVFARDDYTCTYCGERGRKLECDHIIPASRGGSHELSNLTTACFRCNRSKRDKTPEEWLQ
ncbi:HNH endonuclease [Brevibacillus borstelensis]|uniref:HNH endonuclease n=1 Tax=Brevibacillus borstelensis TaxID=45462 RepID=UPI0030C2F0EB